MGKWRLLRSNMIYEGFYVEGDGWSKNFVFENDFYLQRFEEFLGVCRDLEGDLDWIPRAVDSEEVGINGRRGWGVMCLKTKKFELLFR